MAYLISSIIRLITNNAVVIAMFTYSQCPKCRSEAKRSDVPFGHASMLLLGEGSEATEPYNKYEAFFGLVQPKFIFGPVQPKFIFGLVQPKFIFGLVNSRRKIAFRPSIFVDEKISVLAEVEVLVAI